MRGGLQSYHPVGARVLASFYDGRVAVTTSTHGDGRTLLIGTHISAAHFRALEEGRKGATAWFRKVIG